MGETVVAGFPCQEDLAPAGGLARTAKQIACQLPPRRPDKDPPAIFFSRGKECKPREQDLRHQLQCDAARHFLTAQE